MIQSDEFAAKGEYAMRTRGTCRLQVFIRSTGFACLLVWALAGLLAPAHADQKDPRLDDLFAHLQDVTEPQDVFATERKIWSIWLEASDEKAQRLLDAGIDAMNKGDHGSAMDAFDEVIAVAPDFAEGWNKRATLHYIMGNLERSLEDIEKTLELEPRHFGALSGRGLVYANLDDLEKALIAFEDALAVNPKMAGPRVNADAIREVLKKREI